MVWIEEGGIGGERGGGRERERERGGESEERERGEGGERSVWNRNVAGWGKPPHYNVTIG